MDTFNNPLPTAPDFPFVPRTPGLHQKLLPWQQIRQREEGIEWAKEKGGKEQGLGGCSHFYLSFVSINSIIPLSLAQSREVYGEFICFGHENFPKQVLCSSDWCVYMFFFPFWVKLEFVGACLQSGMLRELYKYLNILDSWTQQLSFMQVLHKHVTPSYRRLRNTHVLYITLFCSFLNAWAESLY